MPTLKRRLNISMPSELEEQIKCLAERDQVPQATKALHLLKTAIEIEEDDFFNELASSRDVKGENFVNHSEAWN